MIIEIALGVLLGGLLLGFFLSEPGQWVLALVFALLIIALGAACLIGPFVALYVFAPDVFYGLPEFAFGFISIAAFIGFVFVGIPLLVEKFFSWMHWNYQAFCTVTKKSWNYFFFGSIAFFGVVLPLIGWATGAV